MATPFYKKLEGWPALLVLALGLAVAAYYGASYYKNISAENERILAELESAREKEYQLLSSVREKEATLESFQSQIKSIGSTVGTLEKLSQTDEELLKKYSKVYFLNENYVPAGFYEIDSKYLLPGTGNSLIYAKVWPHLRNLLEAARSNGHELLVASAYRSFAAQSSLKSEYKVLYGAGTANQFSADQGYSEHQLGTSLDLTTPKTGGIFNAFKSDPAYQWLLANAHNYGFILSYPEGNAYYKFEPWHWRFVGRELATRLHDEGKHFYDLDQREIDKYLISLFD
jgi:zinc D-Ala-D-Ala carboxypeptidase